MNMALVKKWGRIKIVPMIIFLEVLVLWTIPSMSADTESYNNRLSTGDIKASDISQLTEELFSNSPRVAASRASWASALEVWRQTGALPDPSVSFTYFPTPVITRLGANRTRFTLNQNFPDYLKRRFMKRMALKNVEAEKTRFDIEAFNTLTDLKISYAELQYLQRAIELTNTNRKLAERVLSTTEKDYGENKSSFQDYTRAESTLARVDYDLLLLDEMKKTEEIKINTLLNREPQNPVVLPAATEDLSYLPGLETLYSLAEENSRELQLAEKTREASEYALGAARRRSRPDIMAGVMYNSISAPDGMYVFEGGRDSWGITIGMNLPIRYSINSAAVKEASFRLESMKEKETIALNNMRSTIATLYFKTETSRRLVELYRNTLVPQARKSLEMSEIWYNSSESTTGEVMEIQSTWLNFELALSRARADYAQNMARLERAVGKTFSSAGGELK